MLERPTIVAAYNATEGAADGLALARLLADLTATELVIVRVLDELLGQDGVEEVTERCFRDAMRDTRRSMLAALTDASADTPIALVADTSVAQGLHSMARAHDIELLVVGPSHHSRAGRVLVGGSAERIMSHAPCAVATAPPGFRQAARLPPGPIACAYDGTAAAGDALRAAADLARAAGTQLRAIAVATRPKCDTILDQADTLVRDHTNGEVEVERTALDGDPASALIAQSHAGVGMLCIGSHGRGRIRRAVLGDVAPKVVRHACCPVVVTPSRG